jgi:predicted XRE-type DNA-binding protein
MIKKRAKKSSGVKFRSVWDALEENNEASENMKVRSALMRVVHEKIVKDKLTQADAAELLKISQPRVSDLMRGKIDLFATDALINMAAMLGLRVEIKVKTAA